MGDRGFRPREGCAPVGGMVFCAVLLLVGSSTSCKSVTIELSDLACDGNVCAAAYACHPQKGICVPMTAVGCTDADSTCPGNTQAGDACPSQDTFIPCRAGATGCNGGCRTCQEDLTWSKCASGECITDADNDFVPDCYDNCPGTSNGGQADEDRDGLGDACDENPSTPGFKLRAGVITSGGGQTASMLHDQVGAAGRTTASEESMASENYTLKPGVVRAALGSTH